MRSRSPRYGDSGPCRLADHTRDDSMDAIAKHILAAAPPRFALAGLSMGGYLALTIVRHAPERVQRLRAARHLGATRNARSRPRGASPRSRSPRPADSPRCRRCSFPVFVHRNRQNDEALRERVRLMAEETGAQAFLRQQQAIMTRPDARPFLPAIKCPTLVLVGDGDELTPPALVAGDRRRRRRLAARRHRRL